VVSAMARMWLFCGGFAAVEVTPEVEVAPLSLELSLPTRLGRRDGTRTRTGQVDLRHGPWHRGHFIVRNLLQGIASGWGSGSEAGGGGGGAWGT